MSEKDSGPVEAPAYNGRPADKPLPNSTFAQRANAASSKAVDEDAVEDKSVGQASSKSRKSTR